MALDFSSEIGDEVKDGLTQEELHEKLEELSTKEVDLDSLVEFDVKPVEISTGEISFTLERSILGEAATNLRILASSAYPNLRIGISHERMSLEIYTSEGFMEASLPLTSSSVSEEDGTLSIIIQVNTLISITQNISDAMVSFIYEADTTTLRVVNGYDISISNLPTSLDFVEYFTNLKNAKKLGDFNTLSATQCAAYIREFAPKQGVIGNLTVAEWGGGKMYGGDTSHIGIMRPKEPIAATDFNILQSLSQALSKICKMMSANTKFFETEDHYIIRDEFVMFGWIKSDYKFPSVKAFEDTLSETSLICPRLQILGALKRMRIPLPSATSFINLAYDKDLSSLKLTAVDDFGKTSRDLVEDCTVHGDTSEWSSEGYSVNLTSLIKLLGASNLSNVLIKLAANESVLAIIDDDDEYKSNNYLTIQT